MSVALWVFSLALAGASDPVTQGLQREFVYLDAERQALEARLAVLDGALETERELARSTQEDLAAQIVAASAQTRAAEARLDSAAHQAASAQGSPEGLTAMLLQANELLARHHVPGAEDLPNALSRLVALLPELAGMGTTNQTFFTPEGVEVQGKVLRLGDVAAWGVSGAHSGVLAPAGGGAFKLWPAPNGAESAAAVASGGTLSTLTMYLHGGTTQPAEARKEKTAKQILDAGGPIGWVIAALGLLAAATALRRLRLMRIAGRSVTKVSDHACELAAQCQANQAQQAITGGGPLPALLRAILRSSNLPEEEHARAIDQALLEHGAFLDRGSTLLPVIAAVAPLLGLLGTVTGMMATFDAITAFGNADPRMLSSGISEALVTTELGLVVAIPTLLVANLLGARAEKLRTQAESTALRLSLAARGRAP